MKHRTVLIAAASIAAVVAAAALAVAVNLGILTVAESSPVGELTTSVVSRAAASPAARHQAETASPAPSASVKPRRQTQDYVIRKAGTVRIASSDTAVRFVDARARSGWRWKLSQTTERRLTVTFTRGSDAYAFVAAVGADGKVTAEVDRLVTQVVPSSDESASWTAPPAPATATPKAHESGDHRDHDDDDADD